MKMVTAGDIYDFLNVCAPFETAMSFDNAGFLVGERQTPVSAVLLALDITPDVVGEAARLGAELISAIIRSFFSRFAVWARRTCRIFWHSTASGRSAPTPISISRRAA